MELTFFAWEMRDVGIFKLTVASQKSCSKKSQIVNFKFPAPSRLKVEKAFLYCESFVGK
jgi:hypothetical protein